MNKNVLDHGYIKLVGSWGDDLSPLIAARMSTDNPTGVDSKKDDGLRDYLWRHQHTSPFEFAELILEVQCPIFVAREWMRHRTFSYNEYSQRYSEALDMYYVPEESRLGFQDSSNKQSSAGLLESASDIRGEMIWEQKHHRETYDDYIEQGLARELARINMPVSNYTKFQVKGNLKNWFHFIKLRIADNAQYEIRVYAQAILEIVKDLWPKLSETFEEHTLHSVAFSKSEIEIVRTLLEGLDSQTIDEASDNLSPSRLKEFKQKLGIV